MNSRMALLTDRLDIEPVFWFIVPMMVLYGLFTALALNGCRMWQNSLLYGLPNSTVSLVLLFGSIVIQSAILATFIAYFVPMPTNLGYFLMISLILGASSRWGLFILLCLFSMAFYAICKIAIRILAVFVVIRDRFNSVALAASFRYDVLSHDVFLFQKRYRLEPLAVRPVSGSFNSTRDNESCQRKIGGNLCR